MDTLKQIEEDIRKFFSEDKENTGVFFNESDFQMHLAHYLRETGYKVFCEYVVPLGIDKIRDKIEKWRKRGIKLPFPALGVIYIDILVEKDELFYPIELKYKTKKEGKKVSFDRFGEKFSFSLKNQGRVPLSRYDFWKDVARIEFLKECFDKVEGGLSIFLTNEEIYKKEEEGISKMFTMGVGQSHKDILNFENSNMKKEDTAFSLLKDYEIKEWENIEIDGIEFYYCIVEV